MDHKPNGEFVEVSNAANPAAAALGVKRYQYKVTAMEEVDVASLVLSRMDEGLTDDEVRTELRNLVDGGRIRVGDLPDVAKLRTR